MKLRVFDILGNKVMGMTGNSINMEHLSNATYIVNALDVETQESLSYKVIRSRRNYDSDSATAVLSINTLPL